MVVVVVVVVVVAAYSGSLNSFPMISLTVGNMNSYLCMPYSGRQLGFGLENFTVSRKVSFACFVEKDTIAHQCSHVAYELTNCVHRLLGKS